MTGVVGDGPGMVDVSTGVRASVSETGRLARRMRPMATGVARTTGTTPADRDASEGKALIRFHSGRTAGDVAAGGDCGCWRTGTAGGAMGVSSTADLRPHTAAAEEAPTRTETQM